MQAQCWQCCVQVVTGESGSDEDRQRDGLLRRATELRGSISRAQDRYGAVMDALRATEDMAMLPSATQQVRVLYMLPMHAALSGSQNYRAEVMPLLSTQDMDLHLQWHHRSGSPSNLLLQIKRHDAGSLEPAL